MKLHFQALMPQVQSFERLLDAHKVLDMQILLCQNLFSRPTPFPVLFPKLHHNAHLMTPHWENAIKGFQRSRLNINRRLPSRFGPCLKKLTDGCFLGIREDVFAAEGKLGLCEDCCCKGADILVDIADGKYRDCRSYWFEVEVFP
jgi:hypothetical protein